MMQDAQTIGKIVYEEMAKQQAAQAAAGEAPPSGGEAPEPPKSDDVIDAEFEVKDSKN
jgi:hypothetical protein